MRRRTDTQTDTQTRVTTMHFSWSTTHAKCNKSRRTDVKETAWRSTSAAGLDVSTANQRRTEAGPIGTEVQCLGELGTQARPV